MSIQKLDFQKIVSEKTPYTVLLNSVIKNIKDPIAGFIWIYLYSQSGEWDVIKVHLKNKFKIGDDKLKDIFSYLNRANLIEYVRGRKDSGHLDKVNILVLGGDKFKEEEPYKTIGVKSTPVVFTTGVKTTRVENHSSGYRGLEKKDIKKERELEKKDKSFYKNQNEKKHEWAAMKNESVSIREHEKQKKMKIPPEFKDLAKKILAKSRTGGY